MAAPPELRKTRKKQNLKACGVPIIPHRWPPVKKGARMNYTKRKDGRYCTRVYIGRDANGKKQYRNLYDRDPKQLRQKEADLRRQLDKGIDVMTLRDSFRSWRDRLLAVKELDLTAAELSLFRCRTDAFVQVFGDLPLKEVTQTTIQPVISALAKKNPKTGKPTAKRTLARYLAACSAVFEYAIESRAADFNPCKYVRIPKDAPKTERRALTEEECRRVEEFDHRARPAAMLMLYSGLRRGEATALLWSDVNLENNTISVTKSYNFKECCIKPPKTESGVRIVSIPQKLSDFLAGLPRTSPYVLTTADNKMMTGNAWISLWDSYMCDMNLAYGNQLHPRSKYDPRGQILAIEPFTLHCLRHTFCTLMYHAGVDVLTCQKQMGHADVRTTLNIYAHLDAIHKKKSIENLDAYLKKNDAAAG